MGKYGFADAIKPGQYNIVDIDNRHEDYSTNRGKSVLYSVDASEQVHEKKSNRKFIYFREVL